MGFRLSFTGNGITLGGWTPTGSSPPAAWLCISKSIETPDDTTYIEQPASTNNTAFFKLSPSPLFFSSAISVTIQVRARVSATKNAPTFGVTIYQNDEATPMTVSTGAALTTSFVTYTFSVTLTGANTKAVWDTAKLAIGTSGGTAPTCDISAIRVTHVAYNNSQVSSPTLVSLPSIGSNVASIGTVAWGSPGNITLTDGNFAAFSSANDGERSNYLQGFGYGFSLPSNAIIQGIVAQITHKASVANSNNNVNDAIVGLIKGGVVSGNNYASASRWTTGVGTIVYGTGATDLWGLSLQPSDVNATNFGLALQAQVNEKTGTITGSVDSFTLQIYYTVTDTSYMNPGYLDATIGRPSYINSIQYFTTTIASAATSGAVTISSVNANNAEIIWGGDNLATDPPTFDGFSASVALTNATTVTATRNTPETGTLTVQGCVVEYISAALNSAVQYGTITLGSGVTSNTATISSVNTNNAFVAYLGFTSTNSTTNANTNFATLALTNATTVTATRNTGTASVTVGYVVVEYAPGIVKSMQPRSVTMIGTNTSTNDTISAVNVNNAYIRWGNLRSSSTTSLDAFTDAQIINSTTVALTRNYTTSETRVVNYTVVEFFDGILKSIHRQKTSINSGTSGVSAIGTVNINKAALCWNGQNIDNGTTTLRSGLESLTLASAMSVVGTRGFSTTAITGATSDLIEYY